jgi:hypothetical protein
MREDYMKSTIDKEPNMTTILEELDNLRDEVIS